MHANGRRLFRAAVRLHAYAAVRTNLSPYRAVFEAFLRLIYRIRQVPVCTQPPYYPPFALKFRLRLQPGFFISEEPPLLPAAFRLFFRRPPGVSPPPLSGYHSGSFWSPSRRRPVAAFLNLCRRFRDADIVRPRPFSGNPVARQNRLPGKTGCPADRLVFRQSVPDNRFPAGRRPNEKQQSESGLLHTSIALAGDQ